MVFDYGLLVLIYILHTDIGDLVSSPLLVFTFSCVHLSIHFSFFDDGRARITPLPARWCICSPRGAYAPPDGALYFLFYEWVVNYGWPAVTTLPQMVHMLFHPQMVHYISFFYEWVVMVGQPLPPCRFDSNICQG